MTDLDQEFEEAKRRALAFIAAHNSKLPTAFCPSCGDESHPPGLRCPGCGYIHHIAWVILREGEWGYEVVALTNRKRIVVEFRVQG